MKFIHTTFKAGLLAILLYAGTIQAQTSAKEKEAHEEALIKEAIDTKNFVFKAQTIIPSNGISRPLNADYDLNISDDKLVSFLPYMGRLYMPLIDPAEGPLRFTSTDFDYNMQTGRKGGWQISIKPKDVRSVREFNLNVMESGYATLQVNGNDRQPVTFYGYVINNKG